ncbi:MAG: bifunctional 3-deoxy-7-phosphoheptulonate synthase/chorismate mutase type II [Bacteroidetes bacterium]|nr:bifunctional 3-deoxy-7-phosphoheptulonate synthase/chorismate mutase type II [Bacteroidota bacterium]
MHFAPLNTWLNFNNNDFALITGPCGAESFEQLEQTIIALKQQNIHYALFRAGVWKPRTRPNSFEGKGEEALKWLLDLKLKYSIKTTVEVANAEHVELALKYKVDALWIGARTTVNPFSVQEIANSLIGRKIPVLIKNPVHADLQLWIGAIERIYAIGNNKIAAIHRGFHSYGNSKYRNKPLWQIPIELKTLFPSLPIINDPSHICGKRELIIDVAQKALNICMDGLMIESHVNPKKALSDAEQQLSAESLSCLLSDLVSRKNKSENIFVNDKLTQLRKIIDEIDDELINILKQRIAVVEEIGEYKKENNISVFQLERWQSILNTRSQWAKKMGVSQQHVEKIFQLLHQESIRLQNEVMSKASKQ